MNDITPKFSCQLKDGKLVYKNQQKFNDYLKSLPVATDLELILKKKRNQRSLEQNAWYWGVALKCIFEETGNEPKDMHEILKSEFLQSLYEFEGKVYTIIKSTADLNTKQFSEYMDKIQKWASLRGIYIPDPNEVDYDELIYK